LLVLVQASVTVSRAAWRARPALELNYLQKESALAEREGRLALEEQQSLSLHFRQRTPRRTF
jgi:hypothetical protein